MACLKGKLLFVQFSDFHSRILKCIQDTFLVRDYGLGQAEVGECLLLFGAESSVIQVAVQKFKDQDI